MVAAVNDERVSISATVAVALDDAQQRYARRNPASRERWDMARQSLPGGNTRTVLFFEPFPVCMVRGEGCTLFDADGHQYVDLLGEYTAGLFGHSNPVIRAAIVEALGNGLSLAAHNQLEARLAGEICDRFASIELVRFTNSGTEANLMALATAIAFTGRRRILVFEGAYHGGVLTFGAVPSPVTVPHEFVIARYNDASGARELIRRHSSDLAAVLVEPMQGAAGCTPGTPEFLAVLSEEARAAGAMLIFDEVQTSRLSRGGRQALLGLTPDLTTLGKYLGGGLSFGAFGGRAALMSQYDPSRPNHLAHAGTFNNNVLSMAAGYAGLSQVLVPGVLEKLNGRGDALRASLDELFTRRRSGLFMTGLGSLLNFHMRGSPATARATVELLFFDLLERGFYSSPRGLVALSLPVGQAEAAALADCMADVLAARPEIYGDGR